MIRATIHLPKYNWTIYAYIAVDCYYTYEILEKMRSLGASREHLFKAHANLINGRLDSGITYTADNNSVWVISMTSSAQEFFNTIVHEIRHLQQHIANVYGMDEDSEEVCYLCGDIAFSLFPYCKDLLCQHCRG